MYSSKHQYFYPTPFYTILWSWLQKARRLTVVSMIKATDCCSLEAGIRRSEVSIFHSEVVSRKNVNLIEGTNRGS